MWMRENCTNISDDQRRRSCRYIFVHAHSASQCITDNLRRSISGVWRRRRSGFTQCNHPRSTIDGEKEKKWHATFLAGRRNDQATSLRIISTGLQPSTWEPWDRTSGTADAFLVDGTSGTSRRRTAEPQGSTA